MAFKETLGSNGNSVGSFKRGFLLLSQTPTMNMMSQVALDSASLSPNIYREGKNTSNWLVKY